MNKRKLTVRIGSLEDMAKDFIKAWHQAEAGHAPKVPIEKITFENEQQLFKTLTPRRCDLLRYVHEHGKISIRALAKELSRDYSNVHQDVKVLNQAGFILKDAKNNKYYVPWDVIVTEIPMTLAPPVNETKKVKVHLTSSHAHIARH